MYIIAYLAVIVFCSIYGPQPLMITLRQEFGVSEATVSLIITFVLAPLSFAPLIYGYILESASIKKLLIFAFAILAVTMLAIFISENFWIILAMRLIQGLIIPAILTGLMTYISTVSDTWNMGKAFAIYISSTIFGGFLGRAASGAISTMFGWRYSFLALFITLIIALALVIRLSPAHKADFARIKPSDVMDILRKKEYLRVYLLIACVFFVFVAIPNFLPFRLTDITGGISEFKIGMSYSGYLMGMVVALLSPRLVSLAGGAVKALRIAIVCYLATVFVFLSDNTIIIFLNMFIFCGSMALLQATCSAHVNMLAKSHKGVVNGLYISIYYAGGSLGSYLPGLIYSGFGWNLYIFSLAVVVLTALFLTIKLKNINHIKSQKELHI